MLITKQAFKECYKKKVKRKKKKLVEALTFGSPRSSFTGTSCQCLENAGMFSKGSPNVLRRFSKCLPITRVRELYENVP